MSLIKISDFQYKVLSHIYSFTARGTKPVIASKLANVVGISQSQFIEAVQEMDKQLLVNFNSNNHAVWLTPRGVSELEKPSNYAPNSVTNNTTNINAPNLGNIMTGGSKNTQNQGVTNNTDFNSAIESIISLVKESSLLKFQQEDLITDLERIKNLAENDSSQELVEHAKSKINYLETALKATDLAVKVAPYFPQIYTYFEGLIK